MFHETKLETSWKNAIILRPFFRCYPRLSLAISKFALNLGTSKKKKYNTLLTPSVTSWLYTYPQIAEASRGG